MREERVRVAAFYTAQARGFEQARMVKDWLAAEAPQDARRPVKAPLQ